MTIAESVLLQQLAERVRQLEAKIVQLERERAESKDSAPRSETRGTLHINGKSR